MLGVQRILVGDHERGLLLRDRRLRRVLLPGSHLLVDLLGRDSVQVCGLGNPVLSTNWEDVGKKTVECTPPDGMEVKKAPSSSLLCTSRLFMA